MSEPSPEGPIDAVHLVVGDLGQDLRESGLRIDIIELGRIDLVEGDCHCFAAARETQTGALSASPVPKPSRPELPAL